LQPDQSVKTPAEPALFAGGGARPEPPSLMPRILVVGAALLGLVSVFFLSRPKPPAGTSTIVQPLAAEAGSLPITQIAMSEATSLSGGKSTYIDGHITNHTDKTLTGATVQVLFANDEQLPPQVETLPLTLIRTRQPYVDTEPVSAEPIKPGEDREFRLIFEDIGQNWNQQLPAIHIISVSER
jgi:hypothetical protein